MTAVNRATLYTYFLTGSKPTQAQFANLIDSNLNLATTSAQAITADVSALGKLDITGNLTVKGSSQANFTGNVIVSGALAAGSFNVNSLTVTNLTATTVSANSTFSNTASIATVSATVVYPTNIVGTTTNNNAAAGSVGEYVSSTVFGPGSGLSNTTFTNITSISLTAGDWDVNGSVAYAPAAGTVTSEAYSAVTQNSANPNGSGTCGRSVWRGSFTGGNPLEVPTGPCRFSLSSTTTIYLVAYASFTTSTITAYGEIRARRIR